MAKHIGLLYGHETELPQALSSRLAGEPGIVVGPVRFAGVTDGAIPRWDVILDRFSHRVPCYRHFLKSAALAGSQVINDPFWQSADDRFLASSLAARLGIRVPRAVLLPQHSYGAGVRHDASLHNLAHPLPWGEIVHYVTLPALLRPTDAGLEEATVVADLDGLWQAFDRSGERVCMLQQQVRDARQVIAICVNFEHVLICGGTLPAGAVEDTRRLSRALGYPLLALTWAVGSRSWLLDCDPQPRLDTATLGPRAFDDLVELLAQALCAAARSPSRTRDAYRWAAALR